jgi:undecaprenyl pyrophosphate phosphatase UppP
MNLNGDLYIAIGTAIAIVVGFVVFLWRMSRGVASQNKGGGCLLFLGSAFAVLLTIPYGISTSPIAHQYQGFYFAVAVILCLTGVIKASLAEQQQRSAPTRDRDASGLPK